jgi:hypothetical protein
MNTVKLVLFGIGIVLLIGAKLAFTNAVPASTYQTIAPSAFCPDAADYNRMKNLWPALKSQYAGWATSIPSPSWGSSAAYVLPDYLHTTLEMAMGCQDIGLLSDIAEIYLEAAQTGRYQPLTNTDGVTRRYWKGDTDGEPDTSAAQWFGALSRTLAAIAATPSAQRTPKMNEFVITYKSTIAGFYKNRMYTATNWQGGGAAAFINILYNNYNNKTAYTAYPAISKYLYGLAQVYLANKADPSTIDLAGNGYPLSEATITQTLKDGARYLKQRTTPTSLTNLKNEAVTGYNYEAGYWQDLEDNQYSEYDGPCYPILNSATQMALASSLASYLSNGAVTSCTTPGYRVPIVRNYETSWDTSHMYIPIMFWEAMYTVQPLINSDFPTYSDMQKYANQLAYGVSNKDINYPKFKNYWSGSNGWVRLNYSAPNAPWQTSAAIMDNGIGGALGAFNTDLRDMTRRIRNIMNSKNPTDVAFTKFYYSIKATDKGTANSADFTTLTPYYRDYETNPNSYYWFLFLSSIPPAIFQGPHLGGGGGGGSDTTPPTVNIQPPLPNASLSRSKTITATASDAGGIAQVVFYIDGVFFAQDTSSPYSATLVTTKYPNGAHNLTAQAFDTSGNTTTSTPVPITINNTFVITSSLCTVASLIETEPPLYTGTVIVSPKTATSHNTLSLPTTDSTVQFIYNGV